MGFPDAFDAGLAVCRAHDQIVLGATILRFHKRWANNPEEAIPVEVKQAVDALGAERVVFGSNLPEYRPIQVKRASAVVEVYPSLWRRSFAREGRTPDQHEPTRSLNGCAAPIWTEAWGDFSTRP